MKRVLSVRERRKLGITFYGVLTTLRAMKRDGVDVRGTERRERAEMVFSRLLDDRPDAVAEIDWDNIDWDAILAFIEKVIELVMKLIAVL